MARGTELRKLFIEELSGVDDPAHGQPDWLLMKSRDGGSVEDVLGEIAEGYERLEGGLDATEDYLDGAPDEVRKAHETLRGYVADLGDDSGAGEGVRSRLADKLRGIAKSRKGDDVGIEKDELIALLAEREDRLLKAVDDRLDAAAEEFAKASGEEDGEGDDDGEQEASLQSISEDVATIAKALDHTLDRVANVEEFLTGRQSAPEKETDPDAPSAEKREEIRKAAGREALHSAFERAASGERVTLS